MVFYPQKSFLQHAVAAAEISFEAYDVGQAFTGSLDAQHEALIHNRKRTSEHASHTSVMTSSGESGVTMCSLQSARQPLNLQGVNRRPNLTLDRRPILTSSGDGLWWQRSRRRSWSGLRRWRERGLSVDRQLGS
jgi:hypothetical protein